MIPKVSLCIPCYNQTQHLKKTLDSIVNQDYQDYELIISDDSTDDRVLELIQNHRIPNEKIRYYKNSPSLGTPENWNFAIEKSQGSYIKIMHHDDYFISEKSLSELVNLLEKSPKADFAFCAAEVRDLGSDSKRLHYCPKWRLELLKGFPESLFLGNIIGSPSATIFRKNAYVPFDGRYKWVVDFDFYIKILKKNPIFSFTHKALTCNVFDSHNVTNFCEKKAEVDLIEHLELFNELLNDNSTLQFRYYFLKFFLEYFAKYGVTSSKLLKNLGYERRVPFMLNFLILITQLRFFRLRILGKKPGTIQNSYD